MKFGVVDKMIQYPRYIYDFRHLLKNLCNDKEILFIDDDPEIGCQYLKNYKNGDNILGQYLMNICKYIDISDNIYDSFNYNMVEFIENDIFMKRWMTAQVEYIMCIIVNIISYMTNTNNENIKIDIEVIKKILSNIIKYDSDIDLSVKSKVPNFFYDIIRKKSNNFYNFYEIGQIVTIIWHSIIENISILNTNNQHEIKLAVYKMQLILSSKQNCEVITDNENDDCICIAILYLIKSINNIHNITNLEQNEINCIKSILLKNYNKIKKIDIKREINQNDLNDIFGNYIVEDEIIEENEDINDEDRDEYEDEENIDYEDGGGNFTKYNVKADGDSFYISIFNALRKTKNSLKQFVECIKNKYKATININRENTFFVDDLRKVVSDNIDEIVENFYKDIKEIKDEDDDEKIKTMSKSFGKQIGQLVIKYFIDNYEKDSNEEKLLFIENIKKLLRTSRISSIKELDVKFCINLLESCGIKLEIKKDIKDFTKNNDTIYLYEYEYKNEIFYRYVLWKDENTDTTHIDTYTTDIDTKDKYTDTKDKYTTANYTTVTDKDTTDKDTPDKEYPFDPENIIKKDYEEMEFGNDYEEETITTVNKRQISILSSYFKKQNIEFDPKIISDLIQTFKSSKLSQKTKYKRINFFVFKNKPVLSNSPIKINQAKIKWLFNNKNYEGKIVNLDDLKLTEESIYSITPWREADQISQKIIKYISKPVNDIIITDATANVGGNTISFYNFGIKTVNSVEIDSMTCDFLKNNLNVYNYNIENVICGNYLKVKDELIQDCVFIDPPWGGKNYANKKILDLYLGKTNVTDIIFDLFVENKTKLIVLKAPLNYNYHSIELILKKIFISERNICGIDKEIIKRNGKPSYYIYYIYTKMIENSTPMNPIYGGEEEYDPMNPIYGGEEEYDPMNPGYGDEEPQQIVKTDYCYIKIHDKYQGYYGKILNIFDDDSILINVLPKTKTKMNIGMTKILNGNYEFVSKNDYENSL
jgi:16S rRNA G966 N2-methylase RsmD